MTDLRDPTECERCGDEYMLRDGDDPTPHCDHCAHDLVASLTAENERLREALTDLYECMGADPYDYVNDTHAAMLKAQAALQPAATKGDDHE